MANVREKRGHATPIERRHSLAGDFCPKEIRRAYRLLASPTCAREVVMHPLYQATCEKFLTAKNWFWSGNIKTYSTGKPQITNTVCFSIKPGARAQPLHRDDWCYHVVAERADTCPENLQHETGIGWFVAGKDTTLRTDALASFLLVIFGSMSARLITICAHMQSWDVGTHS